MSDNPDNRGGAHKPTRGKRQPQMDRWIIPFFKQYRGALCLALFLGILTFAFASALMFTSGYLISRAAEAPGNIIVIFLPIALARIFGVGKPVLHYLERLTSHNWILRMTSNLRLKLYNVLEKDAIFLKQRYRTGDILGLLAEDIGHIQNLYLRSIFPFIIAWILTLLVIIFLGFFSLWFALVMLLLLGIAVVLIPLVSALLSGAHQARRKVMKHELYEHLTDNVLGVSDWIIAGRGKEYVHAYRDSEERLRSVDAQLNRASRNRDLVMQVLYAVIVVALLVWSGIQFGGAYGGAANWIAAFVLGFFPLIEAFAPLPAAAVEMNNYRDSIDRLNELPDEDSENNAERANQNNCPLQTEQRTPASKEKGIENKNTACSDQKISELSGGCFDPLSNLPQAPFSLSIENLSFAYPQSSREVISNLDLNITPGEKLAILGRSGSGKSTLAALVRGDLIPTTGSVSIQGVATCSLGENITAFIGVIQQQTYLFNATLAENLRIGNASATDEELWNVLKKVGLEKMAKRLPEGLATMVDEAGLRFSGGERHRIALARVLLHNVPLVILDEPTVGLDPLTERDLLNTIFETLKDKTVIMITHHLQGVSLMDRVIFLEDGSLKLCGTPDELARSNAYYQKLQAFDTGIAG